MRSTGIALLLLPCLMVFADEGVGQEPTWEALQGDASKSKDVKKGLDLIKKYLKAERELEEGRKGSSLTKVENARTDWRAWLDGTTESLGVDLYTQPGIVVAMIGEANSGIVRSSVKLKKGSIDSGSKPAPGFSRGDIAYTVLVPKSYEHDPKKPYPLVVTLHGRAINYRHPALRKYPEERSRIVIWNNWGGDNRDEQQEAVVVAPTGRPDGFEYQEGSDFLRQTIFLGAGVGCTDYMVDSKRIFVEVYGNAVQDAIEMSTFFAGIILRDREDAKGPPLDEKELALIQNLNGRPFYYVADKAKWATVGKPIAEALEKAYKAAGKSDNLVIEQVMRDANSALKADPEKMAKFLQARLPDAQRELRWLFWRPSMIGPMPLLLSRAGYDYDTSPEAIKLPLSEKCGLIEMKASIVDGVNVLDFQIREAEGARIFLYEPLVDFDLPLTVKVNGKAVLEKEKLRRDWKLFENFCMPRKIFTYPVVGMIDIEFPFMPRVAPKPAVGAGNGAGEKKKEDGEPVEEKQAEGGKQPAATDK